jgi:NitT/TauT family transport system ATP-binding protein
MKEIIHAEHLSLVYQTAAGETEALRDVSFAVGEGEYVSLIGPSGCGKSTLLSLAAGLLTPTGGAIRLPAREKIGYMLQQDGLFDWLTIQKNVRLGLDVRRQRSRDADDYADRLLQMYGLWEFRDRFPAQLSGGMRQRAALIRTLAVRPELLLLDEAFSALDYQTRLAVADDIYAIIRREGKTALMVTHDIGEAVSMSDRVVVLSHRPGTVKAVYDIRFASGRGTPLENREKEEFRTYFNRIWRDIDVHV